MRHLYLTIPFLCSLSFLTACGGGGGSDDATPTTTVTTNTTAAIPTTTSRSLPAEVTNTLLIPETLDNYSAPALPAHFTNNTVQGFDNTPNNNPITNEGATLGRVLFYEKQLSANGTAACASCHEQADGFSDTDRFSTGFNAGLTPRNSMGLANSRFYENGRFFWDERADTLEEQTLEPIQNAIEMGLTLDIAVQRIEAQPYYDFLFTEAFGDNTVTSERIALALAQFVRSLDSFNSAYDVGVANNFANFTDSENRGRQLFFSGRTNCGACHVNDRNDGNEAIFQPNRTFNNGLDAALSNTDNGVGDVTNNTNNNGRFKVGSLRNIELTAPYMHDGRFSTLAEVVEHYNSGVQAHPNLDNRLRQGAGGAPRQMNLTDQEKQDLVNFMLTLTDDTFLTEEKFSNPFRP